MHGGDEPGSFEHTMGTDRPSTSSGNCGKGEDFDELFADFNQELYTGCTKFTKLSFLLKLYHIKCMCGISDKGISMVLDLLKEAFTHAKLPDSFNGMKKVYLEHLRREEQGRTLCLELSLTAHAQGEERIRLKPAQPA
ncbi:unnamed protein product [Microthlaspi erraticum]|uniref:Uncharacterized protein n=1 Tax=Microthlaspi erraticum TaxID=1685480 RepID=A0A6D2KTM7_9BRAS|nr:unnamed protein product [Microthlaspi erraticum]